MQDVKNCKIYVECKLTNVKQMHVDYKTDYENLPQVSKLF